MAEMSKVDPTYCRMKAMVALGLQLTAQDQKNSKTVASHAQNWSPNNVRRLIISPDKITVQWHVGVNGATSKSVGLDITKYVSAVTSAEYKSILGLLAGEGREGRVCSNIEEIVICVLSAQPQFAGRPLINAKDADYKSLVLPSSISKYGSVDGALKARFGRLRGVVYLKCTYDEFSNLIIRNPEVKWNSQDYVLVDEPLLTNKLYAPIHKLNTTDWWKSVTLRALDSRGTGYAFDAEGKQLSNYLKAYKEKRQKLEEEAKKKAALEISNKKVLDSTGADKKYAAAVQRLHGATMCCKALVEAFKQHPSVEAKIMPKTAEWITTLPQIVGKIAFAPNMRTSLVDFNGVLSKDATFARLAKSFGVEFVDEKDAQGNGISAKYAAATRGINSIVVAMYANIVNVYNDVLDSYSKEFAVAGRVYAHEYKAQPVVCALSADGQGISVTDTEFYSSLEKMATYICAVLCDVTYKASEKVATLPYWQNKIEGR